MVVGDLWEMEPSSSASGVLQLWQLSQPPGGLVRISAGPTAVFVTQWVWA